MPDLLTSSGYIPAPAAYVQHLRKLCTQHGILLVVGAFISAFAICADNVDEIQTGFCRTGKVFAIEHSGVTPDIMVFAKGFANGMPLSGIVTSNEMMSAMPAGSLGGTYSGNAVACAAALATTRYMRSHDILGNVQTTSKKIMDGLKDMQADVANGGWIIEEVRGLGVS